MKEMTIKQKAKAYDEALEKARNIVNSINVGLIGKDSFIAVFPVLKENEDERIMKSLKILLQHFCNGYRVPGLDFPVSYKDMLAWLEKHGEQKTVDEIAKEVCKNKESAMAFLKSTGIINEKGELADEYKIEQDEQNPVWSEEDEDYYDAIISKLEVTQDDALLTDNQMKFLKSLKGRYTWKPSESDIRILEQVIDGTANPINYHATLHAILEKLKKLREE